MNAHQNFYFKKFMQCGLLVPAFLGYRVCALAEQRSLHVTLNSLLCVPKQDDTMREYAKIIARDLEFTDQIKVIFRQSKALLRDDQFDKLFAHGTPLCIEVYRRTDEQIGLRVSETASHEIILHKQIPLRQEHLVRDAHALADIVIRRLTNHPSITLTSLAYCSQRTSTKKTIHVSDYAGFQENEVVANDDLNVAPRWHATLPILFYSRFVTASGQLRTRDLRTGVDQVICPYEGLNMQPACSPDGKRIVICMSGKHGNAELYLYDQQLCQEKRHRFFVKLTSNGGNNSSPCYLPHGDIVFCSDFETRLPQLYYLDMGTKEVSRLTSGGRGYCAAPSYSAVQNSLVYTRYDHSTGYFQLFELALADRRERRLTNSIGDKLDPSWSPCGRYVACVLDRFDYQTKRKIPQIALFNRASKKLHVVTKGEKYKSFPVWANGTWYDLA